MRCLLFVVVCFYSLFSADVTTPVYGFISSIDLENAGISAGLPGAKTWFDQNHPEVYKTLHLGAVTWTAESNEHAQVAAVVIQKSLPKAFLVPVIVRQGAGYRISGIKVRRVDAWREGQSDNWESVNLFSAVAPIQPVNLISGGPSSLMVYQIELSAQTTKTFTLSDGFIMPSEQDAANFWVHSSNGRESGNINGQFFMCGQSKIAAVSQLTTTALNAWPGGWVQLCSEVSGEYRYIKQQDISRTLSVGYDPIRFEGQLLRGTFRGIGTQITCSYKQGIYQQSGTADLTNTVFLQQIPESLRAQANEIPIPPAGPLVLDSTHHRGVMPEVDKDGNQTSENTRFYKNSTASQSTQSVVTDTANVVDIGGSATPIDNSPASDGSDRINSPGPSGVNLRQAITNTQAQPSNMVTSSSDNSLAYVDDCGRQTNFSSSQILEGQDAAKNKEVQIQYSNSGEPIEAQKKPIVLSPDGTIQSKIQQRDTASLTAALDIVNAQMAPHMEGCTWTASNHGRHHGAIIRPMDYVDSWMITRYGAATGIMVPDKGGNPVPGDGDNPVYPKPFGVQAGRPFYDFDDDGDLDRFYTDDPFESGYRNLRVSWAIGGASGVNQLGQFNGIWNNFLVTGIKKPKKNSDGQWYAKEDYLFSAVMDHHVFHHSVFKWGRGTYVTYYRQAMRTPMEPFSNSDKTLYQLGLINTSGLGATGQTDGFDPADLVQDRKSPNPETPMELSGAPWVVDVNNNGIVDQEERRWSIQQMACYPRVTNELDMAGAQWTWSEPDFRLAPGLPEDQVASVVDERILDCNGEVKVRRKVAKPWRINPDTGVKEVFDPTTLPVRSATPPPVAISDGYMFPYPVSGPTGFGTSGVPQPAQWIFPWNIPTNGHKHTKAHSESIIRLNTGQMEEIPGWTIVRDQNPLITHESLRLNITEGGLGKISFLLRENADSNPPSGMSETEWRDGKALYTNQGWRAGMPAFYSGRATYHHGNYDTRTDLWNSDVNSGCSSIKGSRIYEVEGNSCGEIMFRGKKYIPKTPEEQRDLLRRMWNYYFTGNENPVTETTLPSVCIPQRWNNWDLSSKPLKQAEIAIQQNTTYITNTQDVNRAGELTGALTNEMASTDTTNRVRQANDRRIRLMKEQVFVFSAARGREWEIEQARRMPMSVKLVCIEWENRVEVEKILTGRNLVMPDIQIIRETDPNTNITVEKEVSTETDILRQIANEWFDAPSAYIGMRKGRIGWKESNPGGDFILDDDKSTLGAKSSTVMNMKGGFGYFDDEGIPAGMAAYAFTLQCMPTTTEPNRQWNPTNNQTMFEKYKIEFRHPMLVLYHDNASSVYVHYGRNADPDSVFGAWEKCGTPPAPISISTQEYRRRVRFENWATDLQLNSIYDSMHPDGHALLAYLDIPVETEPERPGEEPRSPTAPGEAPIAPAVVANPGPRPQAMPPVWTKSKTEWGGNQGGTANQSITNIPSWPQVFTGSTTVETLPAAQQEPILQSEHDAWIAQFPEGGGTIDLISPSFNPFPMYTGTNWAKGTNTTWIWGCLYGCVLQGSGGYIIGSYNDIPNADRFRNYVIFDNSIGIITFTLNTRCTVQLSSFVFDWNTIGYDTTTLESYNGGENNGQIDRTWNVVLGPGLHSFWSQRDGRCDTHRGLQGLIVRIPANTRPPEVARVADADLVAYRAYLQALDTWIPNDRSYQEYLRQYNIYVTAYTAWQQQRRDYQLAYQQYEQKHAIWNQKKTIWEAWRDRNQALLDNQTRARRYLDERSAWLALVKAEMNPAGVSWSGDPGVTRSTLQEIRAITPQIPIWEAYGWFIDPDRHIIEGIL